MRKLSSEKHLGKIPVMAPSNTWKWQVRQNRNQGCHCKMHCSLTEGAPVDVGFLPLFSSVPLSWASSPKAVTKRGGEKASKMSEPTGWVTGCGSHLCNASWGRMWRASEVSVTLLRFTLSLFFLRQSGRISTALFRFSPRSECKFSSTPKAVGWGKETEKGRGRDEEGREGWKKEGGRDEAKEEGQEICSSVLCSGFPE